MSYEKLSLAVENRIIADRESGKASPYAFSAENAVRRDMTHDPNTTLRSAFIRDTEKILHCPYYNRYADKTQVFSFYKNDDITRRALHVQLVSRVARTIGRALNLEPDLIEAISIGHDIGHTPFGHAGETYLDKLFNEHAGRRFSHNIHSVRVLDEIFPLNLTLQTLNGIAAHNGEEELTKYIPQPIKSFDEFDSQIEKCYIDRSNARHIQPDTLEACVMRISDIIAYLGKDRQDAERADIELADGFEASVIGNKNAEMINNLTVNIVEHSYGKDYIEMDEAHFNALKQAKGANYARIYKNDLVRAFFDDTVKPMMGDIYEKMLSDLKNNKTDSPIFRHHIGFLEKPYFRRATPYSETEPNQIVVDYIASMTDDYLIDLHAYLFPDSKLKIEYKGYFNKEF